MTIVLTTFSLFIFFAAFIVLIYFYLIAFASICSSKVSQTCSNNNRFAITIPAHNEEVSIGKTVQVLKKLDYPSELYDISCCS